MKLLVVGDIHLSKYASIWRKRGSKFSDRLERCIESINWAEREAEKESCDMIIYLGDVFDTPQLDAETLTACSEIEWSNIPKYVLVGNHEMERVDLYINSAQALKSDNMKIIDKPEHIDEGKFQLLFLPYIKEEYRKPIAEYKAEIGADKNKTTYIFSHNDIKGIDYGKMVTENGFGVDELEKEGKLTLNGHLHNAIDITENIYLVGNFMGQNFNEDGEKYPHRLAILDIAEDGSDYTLTFKENPHAVYFDKMDFTDLWTAEDCLKHIPTDKNVLLSIRCRDSVWADLKAGLDARANVLGYKPTVIADRCLNKDAEEDESEDLLVKDHIQQFKDYVLGQLGATSAVKAVLERL